MADAVARAWLTGTPEEPIINFDLPAGPKGEPGGWNVGTNLGASNLNNITTPGLYYQTEGLNVTAANNYPTAAAGDTAWRRGVLEVISWGGSTNHVVQRYTLMGGRSADDTERPRLIFVRWYLVGGAPVAWSQWTLYSPSRTVSDAVGFKTHQMWDNTSGAWTTSAEPSAQHLGSVDLNSVTSPGTYRQTSGPDTTLARNYPAAARVGTLSVEVRIPAGQEFGPSVTQIYTPFLGIAAAESQYYYKRTLTGMLWQPWRVFAAQRVDNTGGKAIYTWDDTANREQLIYGDTGWRNIDTFLSTSFIPQTSSGRVAIRRVGSTVNLVLRIQASDTLVAKNLAKNSLQTLLDIPVGFQEYPSSYGAAMVCTAMLGSYMEVLALGAVNANSQLKIMGSTTQVWRSAEIISANISWSTNDPWPTTLPGAALGSIPNL